MKHFFAAILITTTATAMASSANALEFSTSGGFGIRIGKAEVTHNSNGSISPNRIQVGAQTEGTDGGKVQFIHGRSFDLKK
jgi:hypothetical protein